MEEALILLRQLITMFLYVGVGWCLRRFRLVTQENSSALSNLLLYAILPCVIVQSFLREAIPPGHPKPVVVFAAFRAGPGCVRGGVRPVVLEKARLEFWQRLLQRGGLWGFP